MEQIPGRTLNVINLITALLLIVALVFAITATSFAEPKPLSFIQWEDGTKDVSGIQHVGSLIFTEYVIPFEVLSLVLLAALIGGLYMARKEDE